LITPFRTRRQVKEDDLKAAGFKAVEGLGTVLSYSHINGRTRMRIRAMGVICAIDTAAAGAFDGAGRGHASVGDRVLFRGKPLEVNGTEVVLGSLEVAFVGASSPESFTWHVEQWTDEGLAKSGRVELVLPSRLVMAKPVLLEGVAEGKEIAWSAATDFEGAEDLYS